MTRDYDMDTYGYFCLEMRDKAIDELFYDDVGFLADLLTDEMGRDDKEHAEDIAILGLSYALYSQSDTVREETRDQFLKLMYDLIQQAPFFDKIVESKLQDMWERGDAL